MRHSTTTDFASGSACRKPPPLVLSCAQLYLVKPINQLPPLDLGDHWYTLESRPGTKHWDRESLLRQGFAPADITSHDTRPTLGTVSDLLRERIEEEPHFIACSLDTFAPSGGVARAGALWPAEGEGKVVVTIEQGSSEGWYLQVYLLTRDDERNGHHAHSLITGKFLSSVRIWDVAAAVAGWLGLTPAM